MRHRRHSPRRFGRRECGCPPQFLSSYCSYCYACCHGRCRLFAFFADSIIAVPHCSPWPCLKQTGSTVIFRVHSQRKSQAEVTASSYVRSPPRKRKCSLALLLSFALIRTVLSCWRLGGLRRPSSRCFAYHGPRPSST